MRQELVRLQNIELSREAINEQMEAVTGITDFISKHQEVSDLLAEGLIQVEGTEIIIMC